MTKKVSNPKKPAYAVKNLGKVNSETVSNPIAPLIKKNNLSFDFSYTNWLRSINNKSFTNMLKNDSQFTQFIVHIFNKLIPIVIDNWNTIKTNGGGYNFRHCHTVADDKIDVVRKIVEEIHGKKLCDEVEDEELKFWQLGVAQSLRMIVVYSHLTSTVFPVFLDYHHQIYPSDKYNEDDINMYGFCPLTTHS